VDALAMANPRVFIAILFFLLNNAIWRTDDVPYPPIISASLAISI
jgi:hypothetical protein